MQLCHQFPWKSKLLSSSIVITTIAEYIPRFKDNVGGALSSALVSSLLNQVVCPATYIRGRIAIGLKQRNRAFTDDVLE